MKKFFILSALALAAVLFSSCEDKEVSGSSNSILGTWQLTEINIQNSYLLMITLTFRANGTFTETGVESTSFGSYPWNSGGDYTYNPASKLLTLIYTYGDDAGETYSTQATVSGDMLIIKQEDGEPEIYYRQ